MLMAGKGCHFHFFPVRTQRSEFSTISGLKLSWKMNYFSNISSWLKVSAFIFFFLEMAKKLIKSEWMFYHLIFIFFIHINIHSFWYWIPDRDTGNLCNQVCLQFDIGIFPLKKKLEGLKRKKYASWGASQVFRNVDIYPCFCQALLLPP